jgi:hypothetical protein
MQYNFIRLNLTNTYATVIDKNSLPRYMCFKDSVSARNCVSHICHYRSKHGHWPTFDLSEEKHRIERKETPKERKPEDLYKYFDIVTLDEDELNNVCHVHYLSIFYCHEFEIEPLSGSDIFSGYQLKISAEEIDSIMDIDEYKKRLNITINRS